MGMNNHGGKGSASRPLSVPLDDFGQKHDKIFGERKRTNGGWTPPPLPDAVEPKTENDHTDPSTS